MSIEGFLNSQRARRAEIAAEIERMTAENEGVLPKRETRKLRDELSLIDNAMARAQSRGVSQL